MCVCVTAAGLDNIPREIWKSGEFNDIMFQQYGLQCRQYQEMDRRLHISTSQERQFANYKNYKGIIATAIIVKVYNSLLLIRLQSEIQF